MRIGLDRKRFEAALIDGAGPGGVMVGMPALCMGDGDPAQDLREFSILLRPEKEVPVIRHQAIGGDADLGLSLGFGQNLFKGGIVSGLLEEGESSHTTVQDVIGEVSRSEAWTAWHGGMFTECGVGLSRKRLPTPFLNRYRNIKAPAEASAAAENAVALLESGTLRAGAAIDLAAEIRQFKHADPVLGVISAYLYDSIGDVESIRRMAYFYVMNSQPIPYDIALMGQLRGERRPDGLLSVLVPAVAKRKPRTKGEKEREWTYSATREVIGEVGGFWPWMRQGWAFLDDAAADGSNLIVRGLADLTSNLTNARFATLDAQGGRRLIKVFSLFSHR
jgi:hypothetical protein